MAALSASAQSFERRADIVGGGGDRGKCTIEVVVDGAAEVEIRGDRAILRNLRGQPPQWRRFVCSAPLPPNPGEFRFAGVDGRGRQTLVRAPGGGGPAVVRLEDPNNGQEGYTFDIFWSVGGFAPPRPPTPPIAPGPPGRDYDRDRDRDRDRDDRDSYYRDRDEYFRGDWRGRLFERVRQDLDYVSRYAFRGDDRYRLNRTFDELNDLQRDWGSGRFDRRALNDVIDAMGRVVRDNRLMPRDRDMLNDDLNRLREVRDRRR
ncbi:MAG: hypothetical protein LAO79_08730 [Acidobacteriia bacterium]|nr:hypothetical protein [Terriglobia bacterium]